MYICYYQWVRSSGRGGVDEQVAAVQRFAYTDLLGLVMNIILYMICDLVRVRSTGWIVTGRCLPRSNNKYDIICVISEAEEHRLDGHREMSQGRNNSQDRQGRNNSQDRQGRNNGQDGQGRNNSQDRQGRNISQDRQGRNNSQDIQGRNISQDRQGRNNSQDGSSAYDMRRGRRHSSPFAWDCLRNERIQARNASLG